MPTVRPPAVAGTFYPADAGVLRDTVRRLLAGPAPEAPSPRALLVPHAGYIYSGPVAAPAYRLLADRTDPLDRIVLVGPSHFVPIDGMALPGADALVTPLGEIAVDHAAEARLRARPDVGDVPDAHAPEHSLEVQLPFLQEVAPGVPVVAILTGASHPERVAPVVGEFLDDPASVVLASSDLSHYLDYETARRRDRATAAAVERLDAAGIGPGDACGLVALQALLMAARERSLRCHRLDLRNSGDTAGDRQRVVGYGAFAFA